jgi:predicted RecB family nuclease
MKITPAVFEAYLKCPTKCWLRATGEAASGNTYAEWVQAQNASYRETGTARLLAASPQDEVALSPDLESVKAATWRLASSLAVQAEMDSCALESELHAVERVPAGGRGKAAQFIPIRFVFTNKLGKDDKLLLALDAVALSKALKREVSLGKIIHGDNQVTLKVKTSALAGEVRKRLEKIAALLANPTLPDLVLNRHCAECEFQTRCRKIAIEKDDLSLLARMSEQERKKLRSKGIFTVTQLSYTFRPRRRPKKQRDKREKYHHSLKALAIREKKIHIVGTPELKIEGTPVYLDVEGLPDRDFYYLIGLRIGNGESAVQHSLWADTVADEGRIWREFLAILETVEKPVLIHYGSYETIFLKAMGECYGQAVAESVVARAINSAVNVLSLTFAQVYFPSYSNGLKEVAAYLDFCWFAPNPSGLRTVIWRHEWGQTKAAGLKDRILQYNADDCQALEYAATALVRIGAPVLDQSDAEVAHPVVHTELLPHQTMWPRFSSPLPAFEQVNKAARWDYQRERVYVRSSKPIRRLVARASDRRGTHKINKQIKCADQPLCPTCGQKGHRHVNLTTLILHDLFFGRTSLKKWVVEYRFRFHWCGVCRTRFGLPHAFWPGTKFGRRPGAKFGTNLIAYVIYQAVELYLSQYTIQRHLAKVFGYHFSRTSQVHTFKARAAEFYRETRRLVLDRIVRGPLVHVDETRANIRGKTAYVWVFTNLHEVVYLYSDSREIEIAETTLASFSGVLVSDFYSGYDSIVCPQQKCLLHLMRDLNAEILRNPYDEELKRIVREFAHVLKEIVETVDRFGLKRHFLHKHHRLVDRFYHQITLVEPQSEAALKCQQRFERNRDKLFTFLDYDGVPWNNNNAEHAIKAFAAIRDVVEGSSTPKSTEDNLILLSVCQTCKYMGVDFLDFLRSGEKDIHAFAESRRGRRRQPSINKPKGSAADDRAQK